MILYGLYQSGNTRGITKKKLTTKEGLVAGDFLHIGFKLDHGAHSRSGPTVLLDRGLCFSPQQ